MSLSAFRSTIDERNHILKYQPSCRINADRYWELAMTKTIFRWDIGFGNYGKREAARERAAAAVLEKQRYFQL